MWKVAAQLQVLIDKYWWSLDNCWAAAQLQTSVSVETRWRGQAAGCRCPDCSIMLHAAAVCTSPLTPCWAVSKDCLAELVLGCTSVIWWILITDKQSNIKLRKFISSQLGKHIISHQLPNHKCRAYNTVTVLNFKWKLAPPVDNLDNLNLVTINIP